MQGEAILLIYTKVGSDGGEDSTPHEEGNFT